MQAEGKKQKNKIIKKNRSKYFHKDVRQTELQITGVARKRK